MNSDDLLQEAVVTRPGAAPSMQTAVQPSGFYTNVFKRGLGIGAGGLLDFPERAANLAMLPFGYMAQDIFGKTIEPTNYNRFTEMIQRMLGAENQIAPSGIRQAILGAMVEGAGAGLTGGVPLAGILTRGAPTAIAGLSKYLGTTGGLGALAGGGSEIGGEVAGAPGAIAGGLATGVVLPSSAIRLGGPVIGSTRAMFNAGKEIAASREVPPEMAAMGAQAKAAAEQRAAPVVESIINRQVRQSVGGTPNAAENIEEALRLQDKIPGFAPSIAEMSGSRGAAALQERYARLNPQNLNREVARQNTNLQAIEDYYQSIAPKMGAEGEVRGGVNRALAAEEQTAAVAQRAPGAGLPQASQYGVGDVLTAAAFDEKAAATPAIRDAYARAFNAAGGNVAAANPIIEKTEQILGQKLSRISPESAPQVVSRIREFGSKEGLDVPTQMTLQDLDSLKKAVNADIASAGTSMNPMAATRLRNLGQINQVIDQVIADSPIPSAAKQLYSQAVDKYRTEFAPRFKEGANLRVFKDTSANEPRILPERFMSEFFKPDETGGVTRTQQFSQLFKDNPEAKNLARTGILDLYRRDVVDPMTGFVKEGAHGAFLKNYQNTLESYKSAGVNALDDIRKIGIDAAKANQAGKELSALSAQLKFDTTGEMIDAAFKNPLVMGNITRRMSEEGRNTFVRMVMDRAREDKSYAGIANFLNENTRVLRTIPGMTTEHLGVLKDIANAYKVSERAPIRGMPETAGPDILKNELGVSTATVMSQWRAVTGQRSSVFWAAFNVANPIMQKLSQTRFSDIMERALHDRQTAIDLRDFIKSQSPIQADKAGSMLLQDIGNAAKVVWDGKGIVLKHLLGSDRYALNTARAGLPIATTIQEQQNQP